METVIFFFGKLWTLCARVFQHFFISLLCCMSSKQQTAFIPYIVDMVAIGKDGTKDAPVFWNEIDESGAEISAEMTNTDVKFIAAMG